MPRGVKTLLSSAPSPVLAGAKQAKQFRQGRNSLRQTCLRAVATPEREMNQEPSGPESGPGGPATQAAVASAFSTEMPKELDKPLTLEVDGSIPKWLKGSIVRNGPGVFAKEHLHLFDGYAFLVKFEFSDGQVSTQQKFVQSLAFQAFESTGKPQFDEFGYKGGLWKTMKNLAGSLTGGPFITDNSSVNTCRARGDTEIVTLTEISAGSFKVNLDLETLSNVQFKDDISGVAATAHPVIYPDGKIYNLYTDLGKGRCVAEVDYKTQQRKKIADLELLNPFSPPWVHDLPGTENYVIVPDTPVLISLKALLLRSAKYITYDWEPSIQSTRFQLVNRHTGAVKTVEADFDYFTFHYGNAFESEDGNTIHIDCPLYDDPELLLRLQLKELREGKKSLADTPGVYSRISIPLNGGKATVRPLVPKSQCAYIELMRINPEFKFKDYQFVYGDTARLPAPVANAVSKLDVKNGTSKQWYEPGCIPTEPLMIPRPGATEEDDGVVTSLVTGADGKNFLLVLDASSFEEIARAQLPYGIAYGFHNQFYT